MSKMQITYENTDTIIVIKELMKQTSVEEFLSAIGCVLFGESIIEDVTRHYNALASEEFPFAIMCDYEVAPYNDKGKIAVPLFNENISSFSYHFSRLMTVLNIRLKVKSCNLETSHSNDTAGNHHSKVITGETSKGRKKYERQAQL